MLTIEDKQTEKAVNEAISRLIGHQIIKTDNKLLLGIVQSILIQLYLKGTKDGMIEAKKIYDTHYK